MFRKFDCICCVRDRLHLLVNPEVLEWRVAVGHLIEYTAERPRIARPASFKVSRAIGELDSFQGHVVKSTDLRVNKVTVQ